MVQEVHGTILIAQVSGEIIFHQLAKGAVTCLVLVHQVVGVHIAIEIVPTESVGCIHTKAILFDVGGHLIHGASRYVCPLGTVIQQVAQVTGPTGQVVRLDGGGHVRNVHRTGHVTKVSRVTVGQGEIADDDITQVHSGGAVGGILLLYVVGERGDLLSGQRRPVTIPVTLDAGADKVQHQFTGVSAGLSRKLVCIDLQLFQICQKVRVIGGAAGKYADRNHSDDHQGHHQHCQQLHRCLFKHGSSLLY